MKAIITGTSGFIGGRVLKAARSAYGADVVAFSTCAADGKHIIYHDVPEFGLKPADLTLVEGAEVLIHAGAFIPKKGIDANQFSGCNSNVTFTEKLLSLPWNNLKKMVYLSTVDVYADVNGPIDETSTTVPASLYGFSKLYCERMVSLNAADRGIASQILRIGHVFGPGEEKYAKVLPRAIQNIVTGKDVELWGEGSELRSFIYIDDVVSAILQAVELDEEPGVINVVGGKSISIRDLLKKLIEIGGGGTGIVRRDFSASTRDLVFDNSKLKRYLLPEERDFVDGLKAEFRHIASLYS